MNRTNRDAQTGQNAEAESAKAQPAGLPPCQGAGAVLVCSEQTPFPVSADSIILTSRAPIRRAPTLLSPQDPGHQARRKRRLKTPVLITVIVASVLALFPLIGLLNDLSDGELGKR